MRGLESFRSSASGALGSITEHRVHIADDDDRVSVKHLKCCGTLFSGLLIRFILFSVAVNHGSTLVFNTMFGVARGAKAAAEAGKSTVGMITGRLLISRQWLIGSGT